VHELTPEDIDHLVLGATLLGTGGGGDPYIARLMVMEALKERGPVRVVTARELPLDGLVITAAVIGAPTVMIEKVPSGEEFVTAVRALANYLGQDPVAIMPIEVGGMNTLIPIATALQLDLPVIDADSMRRAFPQVEMTVFTLAGIPATPMSIADEKGNVLVLETETNQVAEKLARSAVMQLGMTAGVASYSVSVQQVIDHAIDGSMTYCIQLGKRLADIQDGVEGALEEFLTYAEGQSLFEGKIIDIERHTTGGFARGTVILESLVEADRTLRVEIQNELLIAFENGIPIATTPDLICLLDYENGQPITTETLGYGQRVRVIGLPCAPEWHQPGMLELVGPRAFGYEVDYVPLGEVFGG
jgi:DUF917 family protein